MRTLISNDSSQAQIRKGSERFVVGLQIDDQHSIIYERGKTVEYRIDGQLFQKVARQDLTHIFAGTGLLYDREGEYEIFPQFIFQKETPFPFNLTSSKMYSQFSQFFGVEKLEDVMKSIAVDAKEEKSQLKYKEGRYDQLSLSIKSQGDYLTKLPTEDELQKMLENYTRAQSLLDNAISTKALLDKGRSLHNRISLFRDALSREVEVERVAVDGYAKIQQVSGEIRALENYKIRLDQIDKSIRNHKVIHEATDSVISREPIDELASYKSLREHKVRIDALEFSIRGVTDQIHREEYDLNQVEAELEGIEACPHCGALKEHWHVG